MSRYRYILGFLLVLLCVTSESGSAWNSDQIGKDWLTVKRGTSASPVEFTQQGLILFHEGDCRLEATREDETTTEVQFSPLSPDGEYRVVIGDVYDFEPAYLLDVKKCALMHLAIPRYFQPWASWAPDDKHVLFYSNYEASPQLWILKIETGQVFEVHAQLHQIQGRYMLWAKRMGGKKRCWLSGSRKCPLERRVELYL